MDNITEEVEAVYVEPINNGLPELKKLDTSRGSYIPVNQIDAMKAAMNMVTSIPKGSVVYASKSGLSQSKLRDAGFKITRSKEKADYLIYPSIDSVILKNSSHGLKIDDTMDNYSNQTPCFVLNRWRNLSIPEMLMDIYHDLNHTNNKSVYILSEDIYKDLYKYEGDLTLYTTVDGLFNAGDDSNIRMGLEFISNANWEGNEIYLQALFSDYWGANNYNRRSSSYTGPSLAYNTYVKSVSFSGFLSSLTFDYENLFLDEARRYSILCETDEHHQFVYDKFEKRFKAELDELIAQYKMKVDVMEFSIDKTTMDLTKNEE